VAPGAADPEETVGARGRGQGKVERRPSDLLRPENRLLRPDAAPAWTTVDLNSTWRANRWLRLGLRVANLLDAGGRVVAVGDLPFDHRVGGRRVTGSVGAEF